jgi:hypothetical protein
MLHTNLRQGAWRRVGCQSTQDVYAAGGFRAMVAEDILWTAPQKQAKGARGIQRNPLDSKTRADIRANYKRATLNQAVADYFVAHRGRERPIP